MAAGNELEWLSDYVVEVLKSPTWVVPIAQFIDERCELFDDREENELLHTTCHNEFKQLVNDLLVSHLLEVSVSPENFEHFCSQGFTGQTRLHRTLVEQLLSVDDFLVFKAMMGKHNAELCKEAITCYTLEDDEEPLPPLSPTKILADGVVANSITQGLKSRDAEWQLYEDNPRRLRGRSNTSETLESDQEGLNEAQLRLEEAELEQVIALSLQLEEERLRQLTLDDFPIASPEPSVVPSGVLAPAPPPAPPASAGYLSSPLCFVPPRVKVPPTPRMVEVDSLSLTEEKPRGGAWGFTSAPLYPARLCPAPPQLLPEPAFEPAVAPPVNDTPAVATNLIPKVVGFTSSPLCYRPPAPKPGPAPVSPASTLGAPVVAQEPELQQEVQTSPTTEINGMRSNLQLWRQRAERAFVPTRPPGLGLTLGGLSGSLPQAMQATGPTDEERRQRAEHLKQQRDRLRMMRQREREQQMENFQRSRGGTATASGVDRASAQAASAAEGRRLVVAFSPGAVVASPTAPPLPNAPMAAERMRQAMTLQLRQTLMRTTVSDAGVLDGQLSQLELMRQSG